MQDSQLKPCPMCKVAMSMECSYIRDDHAQTLSFYSVYCKQCGYGPNNAYFSKEEAITHWNNETLSNYLPQIELKNKQDSFYD